MRYTRKARTILKDKTTKTTWVSKPSLWSLKFMNKKNRKIKGVK